MAGRFALVGKGSLTIGSHQAQVAGLFQRRAKSVSNRMFARSDGAIFEVRKAEVFHASVAMDLKNGSADQSNSRNSQ
jgi:hypothetical protein